MKEEVYMRKHLPVAITLLSLAVLPALALAADTSSSASEKSTKSTTLTGCLSGPNADGAYTLKTSSKEVEVGGTTELKSHVGHEVKLTGTWAKTGTEIGANEAASTSTEKHEHHFKVASIQHVAETCTTKDATTEKKSGY
jgi:hypothetical protein